MSINILSEWILDDYRKLIKKYRIALRKTTKKCVAIFEVCRVWVIEGTKYIHEHEYAR